MSEPKLYRFEGVRDAFPELQLSDSWGITTSKCDDIVWNIVLAYLNSFPVSEEKELKKRIRLLTGYEKLFEENKHSIETCNPFLNRDACLSNAGIFNLVRRFKENIEDYIKREGNNVISTKYMKYLQASSKFLRCNIVLISFPCEDQTLVNIFPIQDSTRKNLYLSEHISILVTFTTKDGLPQEKFSFFIPEKIGIQKQRHALSEILKKRSEIGKDARMISEISQWPNITQDLPMSLLKNDLWPVMVEIYTSPRALSELAAAGLATDPRGRDGAGKSAFFYALQTERPDVVFLLYDHAVGVCPQHDAPGLVGHLRGLADFLGDLGRELDSEGVSEAARRLFGDLCRFHEFHLDVCKSLHDLKKKHHDSTEKECDTMRQKQTLLAIVKVYETYFDSVRGEVLKEGEFSCFEEYLEHKDYFDKLDFNAAVLFFDNLFPLIEGLKLHNKVCLEFGSGIFLSLLLRNLFEKRFPSDSRWIIFQERLSLRKQLQRFKEVLEKPELSDFNIADTKPEEEASTFIGFKEINDQFFVSRLKRYLNAATEITVASMKSILVIERCLQVLLECYEENDSNSFKKTISLVLPRFFFEHLNVIRNQSSRRKTHEFLYRNKLEQDLELFKGIQRELIKLNQLLTPLFSINKYESDELLLLHALKSVFNAHKKLISEEFVILKIQKMEERQLSVPTYSCQNAKIHNFDYMDHMNYMISIITERLNNLNIEDTQKILELQYCSKDLEYFLTHTTDIKNQEIKKHFMFTFPIIDNLLNDLLKIKKYKFPNLTIDGKQNEETVHVVEIAELIRKKNETKESDSSLSELVSKRCPNQLWSDGVSYEYTHNREEKTPSEVRNDEKKFLLDVQNFERLTENYKTLDKLLFQAVPLDSSYIIDFTNIKRFFSIIEEEASSNAKRIGEEMQTGKKTLENRDGYSLLYPPVSKGHIKEIPVNRFEFFRSRIKVLKRILIDENSIVKISWDMATTPREKDCVKEKIVHLYLNNPEMLASVEMLLFHFKSNLCSRELEQLWEKTTNLLNGMNLRNFLIQEHSFPESFGTLFDPNALSSELVEKMLKLLSDEYIIDCMQEILYRSENNFYDFMSFMNDPDSEPSELVEEIQECQHWKQYALLIPFQK